MAKTVYQESSGQPCDNRKWLEDQVCMLTQSVDIWQRRSDKWHKEYTKVRKSLGEYFMKFVDANIENIKLKNQLALAVDGLKNCKTRDHIGAVCRIPKYVDGVLKKISDIADYNQPVDDPMDKIHKAVNAANKKLQNNLEIAVDGIYKIANPKAGTSADELINTARETLNKIKE